MSGEVLTVTVPIYKSMRYMYMKSQEEGGKATRS